MYLIVHRDNDRVYAYFETDEHYTNVMKKSDSGRDQSQEIDPSVLDSECDVLRSFQNGQWIKVKVATELEVEPCHPIPNVKKIVVSKKVAKRVKRK
jgi:hypothetical protein